MNNFTGFQFVHIPKCGGTSTWRLLQEATKDASNYTPSHKPLQPRKNGELIFTILRNPIDRIISFYKFVTLQKSHHIIVKYPFLYMSDLEKFCSTLYQAKNKEFFNLMTKFIAGSLSDSVTWKSAIAQVSSGHFDHIGFLENYDLTHQWIIRAAGLVHTVGETPKLQKSAHIELAQQNNIDKALEIIHEANKQDLLLYSYLKSLRNTIQADNLFYKAPYRC